MAQKENKNAVIAELTVSSSLGEECIIGFDNAWCRALSLPRPVRISLNGFVRKEEA